ncbi:uncharacterized protein JCM6883_005784 [Sporobolomyces salmoneus]|uniref:uncharacterized protein n=1 Tax=Sporobolomyces salmoneus TaxID=183962 RepID=UPI00317B8D8A
MSRKGKEKAINQDNPILSAPTLSRSFKKSNSNPSSSKSSTSSSSSSHPSHSLSSLLTNSNSSYIELSDDDGDVQMAPPARPPPPPNSKPKSSSIASTSKTPIPPTPLSDVDEEEDDADPRGSTSSVEEEEEEIERTSGVGAKKKGKGVGGLKGGNGKEAAGGKSTSKGKKSKKATVEEEEEDEDSATRPTYRCPGCSGNGGVKLSIEESFNNGIVSVDALSLFLSHPTHGAVRCRIWDEEVDRRIKAGINLDSFHEIANVFAKEGMAAKCGLDSEELATLFWCAKEAADEAKFAGTSSKEEDEWFDFKEETVQKIQERMLRRVQRAVNQRAERELKEKKEKEVRERLKKKGGSDKLIKSAINKISITQEEYAAAHPYPNLPPPQNNPPNNSFQRSAEHLFRRTTVYQNFARQMKDPIAETARIRQVDHSFIGRTKAIAMIQCVLPGEGSIAERDSDGKWVTERITSDLEHSFVDSAKKLGFFDGEDFILIDSIDGRCGGGILRTNHILLKGTVPTSRIAPTTPIARAATAINRALFLILFKTHHVAPGGILAQSALTQRVLGIVKNSSTYREHSLVAANPFGEIPTIAGPSPHPTLIGQTLSAEVRSELLYLVSHQVVAFEAFHQSPSLETVEELIEANLDTKDLRELFSAAPAFDPNDILVKARTFHDQISRSLGRTASRETFDHLLTRLKISPNDSFATIGAKIIGSIKRRQGDYGVFRPRRKGETKKEHLEAEIKAVCLQRKAPTSTERNALARIKSVLKMKKKNHKLASGRIVNTYVFIGLKMSKKRQESGEFLPFDLFDNLDRDLAAALDKHRVGKQDAQNRSFDWSAVVSELQKYKFFRGMSGDTLHDKLRGRFKRGGKFEDTLPPLTKAAYRSPVLAAVAFPWKDDLFLSRLATSLDRNRRTPDAIKAPFSWDVIVDEMKVSYPDAFADLEGTKLASRLKIQLTKKEEDPRYANLARVYGMKKREDQFATLPWDDDLFLACLAKAYKAHRLDSQAVFDYDRIVEEVSLSFADSVKGMTGKNLRDKVTNKMVNVKADNTRFDGLREALGSKRAKAKDGEGPKAKKRASKKKEEEEEEEDDDEEEEEEETGKRVSLRTSTSTYTQPPESLGVISTIPYTPFTPSSSNCMSYQSSELYTAAAALATSSSSASSSASTTSGASSAASTGASRGSSAQASGSTGVSGAAASQSPSNAGNGAGQLAIGGGGALVAGLVAFAFAL